MASVVSKIESQRYALMSVLCAILVVTIHIGLFAGGMVNSLVSYGIAEVAVPYFFFASGYFLAVHIGEDGWWKESLVKRVKTLLLPLLLWNLLWVVYINLFVCAAGIVYGRGICKDDFFVYGLMQIVGLDLFKCPALFTTWYIRALLILVLLAPIIARISRGGGWFCYF